MEGATFIIVFLISGFVGGAALSGSGERSGQVEDGAHVPDPRHSVHGGRGELLSPLPDASPSPAATAAAASSPTSSSPSRPPPLTYTLHHASHRLRRYCGHHSGSHTRWAVLCYTNHLSLTCLYKNDHWDSIPETWLVFPVVAHQKCKVVWKMSLDIDCFIPKNIYKIVFVPCISCVSSIHKKYIGRISFFHKKKYFYSFRTLPIGLNTELQAVFC